MEIKNGNNFNKKFNIPSRIKSYKIEKELCHISNAHLCLGTNLNIKEKVLIKIYDKEIFLHNSDEIPLINNEIFMMRIINHKTVLRLYEIIESPSYIFLIVEYFNPIKLGDYLKNKKLLTEDESLNIFKQLIGLLLYFNEMNIGHLNINPNDILIDNSHNIKICDLKYSVFYSISEKIKCKYTGDPNYLCPELLSEKSCFPEMADIWSSGVLLYLCVVGQLPFKGINNYDLQKKIMGAEFVLPLNINKNLQELFKNIFEAKVDLRYNLEKILNSALFKEKKFNKNNLPKGFNVLANKYPIDERVINICKTYYEIEPGDIKQKLAKNIFDPQTSLYKQIINKFIMKKISTEIDLTSKKFNNYIENKKNTLEDTIQKNNIQDNLSKLEEIKAGNTTLKTKIEKNENMALVKLNELIEKYKNQIKEEEPIKKEEKKIENENMENKEKNKEEKVESKNENKEENKENIPKNKENISKSSIDKRYRKRGSINYFAKKPKINTYENQLSLNRRMSSAINTKEQIKASLERFNYKKKKKMEPKNKKSQKYISNIIDIIKESKEEEEKKDASPQSSKTSSRSSSISKTSSKIITSSINKNKNKENINTKRIPSSKDNKGLKITARKSKPINLLKEKKNTNTTKKAPPPQVTKEDFFKQIKNVKLKKFTPNTYANPDEIKRKPKEENKNATSVEYTNVSVKNVLKMVEENLKNSKKNKNNLNAQPRKEVKSKNYESKDKSNIVKKKSIFKANNNNKKISNNKRLRRRKSIKKKDLSMFQKKGLLVNKNEIKNVKSKDDVSRFQFRTKKNNDNDNIDNNEVVIEEDLNEIVFPKDYETEKKIKEEKEREEKAKQDLEEKKRRESEEIRKKKEERERKEREEKKKKEFEEKRMKEIEERKKKKVVDDMLLRQIEEEERRKKEKEEEEKRRELEEKKKKELEEKRRKEIEERKKREFEEMLLRQIEEEERRKKEKEEEERRIKEKEEEEKRQRLLEEERRRKREEERERKIKEREEEDRRREEEERLKREREKERIRLEEEEKIRKWIEEAKRQKELEEKKEKEAEEKERKEEEDRKRKRLEESERKRRELQEENRRRIEEYEKMRKEEEDKRIMREEMKRKKEEEIRLKREKEKKEKREIRGIREKRDNESEKKKTLFTIQFEPNNEPSEEEEVEEEEDENPIKKKESILSNDIEESQSFENKKSTNI